MPIVGNKVKIGGLFLLVLVFSTTATEGANFGCKGEKLPCQVIPSSCKDDSCWGVTITKKDNKYTFVARSSGASGYVAVGISKDDKMGEDAVVACASGGILTMVNPNGHSKPEPADDFQVPNAVSASANGHVTCSFTLPDSIAAKSLQFRISESTILVAHGDMSDGKLVQHAAHDFATLSLQQHGDDDKEVDDKSGASSLSRTGVFGIGIGTLLLALMVLRNF